MSIILMAIFVTIPVVLGAIVLSVTFRHWYLEYRQKKKAAAAPKNA